MLPDTVDTPLMLGVLTWLMSFTNSGAVWADYGVAGFVEL
jgi:hypothetical protein